MRKKLSLPKKICNVTKKALSFHKNLQQLCCKWGESCIFALKGMRVLNSNLARWVAIEV
jgi:hypothetical protein